MRRLGVLVIACAMWAGCGDGGGGVDDAGGGIDSGPLADSGTRPDSGPQPDAGPAPDGGGVDAGIDGGSTTTGCTDPIPTTLATEPIAAGTMFNSPVQVVQPPASDDLYVVERGGRVRIVRDGTVLATPFLNVSSLLAGTPSGSAEWGLLSMAFHPDYATNGRFFIGYTPNGGDNIVAEGHRSDANPDVADATVTTLIRTNDFAGNHNGGLVMFGPDGYLYAGFGDGGGACDPMHTGQDITDLLGKIVRLDVSTPGTATAPSSNPFVGVSGAQATIWEYGLRNPWRFSFDRVTGDLWIGDVGQDDVEEIDFSAGNPGGQNYGWSAFEGATTTGCPSAFCTCDDTLRAGSTHHTPITEYSHAVGNSVVGGYVYRGSAIPGLQGVYLYADSYESWVRGIRVCGGAITSGPTVISGVGMASGGAGLVSFGEDNDGELYVVFLTGQVERIVAP